MSPVATKEKPAASEENPVPAAAQKWTRTPEQEELVREHLEYVRKFFAGADPEMRRQLEDTTVWGNQELKQEFGLTDKGNRTSQWWVAGRKLAETDQTPHPIGAPEHDATAGQRGPHEIRGSIAGRWRLWAAQGGKWTWNPESKTFERNTAINSGGAPRRNA